jgi:hypothetical protein
MFLKSSHESTTKTSSMCIIIETETTSLAENCYFSWWCHKNLSHAIFNAFVKSKLWKKNLKVCLAGVMEKECGTSWTNISLFLRKTKWPAQTMKCFKHYKMYWVPEARQFCVKCPSDSFFPW